MGVRYVEFGVEVVNDDVLKYLRKPFRTKHLAAACVEARRLGLYVIPNLIMGIPGDDYAGTIAWIEANVDIVPVVNVNWLATHFGNTRGDLGLPAETFADRDQNSTSKTWLTPEQVQTGMQAIERVYDLTDTYWNGRRLTLASAGTGAEAAGVPM